MTTGGGDLKVKHIVHSHLAKWDSFCGRQNNFSMLESTIREILEKVEVDLRASTISIPAIGTGNMKCPK